jgi:hypothetical protein
MGGLRRISRPLALAVVGRRTAVSIGATARCAASNIAVHPLKSQLAPQAGLGVSPRMRLHMFVPSVRLSGPPSRCI